MLGYYIRLALRSLRGNVVLTALMIAAIGVGIGASMTTVTIFRTMSADPLPEKSHTLFTPQIDNFGPTVANGSLRSALTSDQLPTALTYTDAVALLRAHTAERQAAMYGTTADVTPPNSAQGSFQVQARATSADFFGMFDVPFVYGAPWSATEDESRVPVVVLSRALNERLFAGQNSVGRLVSLNGKAYRVVGVIRRWNPVPRFFDPFQGSFGGAEDVFVPFSVAIAQRFAPQGDQCLKNPGTGIEAFLHSECVWIAFWVELPTRTLVRRYRDFLTQYAAGQRDAGRFNWPPRVALRDVPQWLVYNHVVSNDVTVLVMVSFAFLLVCVLNAVGLMLAKFMARSPHLSIRRALGANHRAVFSQSLVEAATIGLVGGLLGTALTALGLLIARGLFMGPAASSLTHLAVSDVVIALALSIGATIAAGLYPTWRATRMTPASSLRIQ